MLIGFMGTGKSSVARRLAARTGAEFIDTDQLVAASLGRSIPEIFAELGEERFREEETVVLERLPRDRTLVLATGGGIILRERNVALLHELGTVICLTADEETLFARVSRRADRPLLQTADPRGTLASMVRAREPLYCRAADMVIDTSALTHGEVADVVLREASRLSA